MAERKQEKNKRIADEILCVGGEIIASPLFQQGFSQTHHKICTVGEHTLNVTIVSVALLDHLKRLSPDLNRRKVILGALLHDLGIIGRDEKFRNNHESGQRHPAESVAAARTFLPDLDETTEDIIASHMWPVTKHPPKSKEGFLVLTADKYCAAAEWVCFVLKRVYRPQIKEMIRENIQGEDAG